MDLSSWGQQRRHSRVAQIPRLDLGSQKKGFEMFCCHSAGTTEPQCTVEGAYGSNAAGETMMRFAGITDDFRVPHMTGGNERWPHCGGQCRTRSTWRKAATVNLVDDDVHVIVIWSATLVASGQLCRRSNFCVKCFRPANRWDHMHKSCVISVHRL